MTKVEELNRLVEKITGNNPNNTKIHETLDYLLEYLSNLENREVQIAKIIRGIRENYTPEGVTYPDFTGREF